MGTTVALDGPTVAEAGAAFGVVFRTQYAPVLRTVHLLVGDAETAADLTQDAFVQLYVHWRKVSTYERPGAWVRRVAIRQAMRSLRRGRMRARAEEASGPPPPGPGPADLDLRRAVLSLPAAQRAAVVLHYLEDLPVREVAAHLGCTESTAKVHLHRGRKRLGELLGEEADDVAG